MTVQKQKHSSERKATPFPIRSLPTNYPLPQSKQNHNDAIDPG